MTPALLAFLIGAVTGLRAMLAPAGVRYIGSNPGDGTWRMSASKRRCLARHDI